MSAPPADQYYLYVLALSKSVTLTDLVAALTDRLGPLQLVELVTAPPVVPEPPPPWWHFLTVGQQVRPIRDGVPVLAGSGSLWRRIGSPVGVVWDVYAPPDTAARLVCVYPDRAPFPGGLWVSADDIAKV